MEYLILAVVLFILLDVAIRFIVKKLSEAKTRKYREKVLDTSLDVDFSYEAKTLKRVHVENPKAKILAVDDESIILDSFRKILVLDGYAVDTVESGKEAMSLLKTHHYDFVFTDLKMPEMDGVEVTKSVKHIRPDIDVVIITGYATVETAVETMKYGAMDYVQKPFTEDELLDMVKRILVKRQDSIKKKLMPNVEITQTETHVPHGAGDFSIPGGIFVSAGHTWASVGQDGNVKIGIDDFAKKTIGKVSEIEMPNLGMTVERGQTLFSIKQGNRSIPFKSPVSGKISKINSKLNSDLDRLDLSVYDTNWMCIIDADNLDSEVSGLKIGKSAVVYYLEEIERYQNYFKDVRNVKTDPEDLVEYYNQLEDCSMEELDDSQFKIFADSFFGSR